MGGTTANSWPLIQPEKAVKCAENTQNHQKWTEPGPYGSVWADTCTESIPRALGSLWDASRALKRPQKSPNPGFGGLGVRGEASPLFPLFALKGCGQKFNNPMQRLVLKNSNQLQWPGGRQGQAARCTQEVNCDEFGALRKSAVCHQGA